MRLLRFALPAIALAALTLPGAAQAQEYYYEQGVPTQPVRLPSSQLDEIAELVKQKLDRDSSGSPKGDVWEDTSGEKWSLRWGGRMMFDYVMWGSHDPAFGDLENYAELRRGAIFVSGSGYGVYDFKLQFDFSADNDPTFTVNSPFTGMKDVYIGIHEIPLLGYVRFGHYKAPFGLEQLTSSRFITFMERSLPDVYTPGREVGVAAFNHSAGGNVTWAYGVFFDGMSESLKQIVSDNMGAQFVGRITWTPIYDEPSNGRYLVHVGGGVRYVNDRNSTLTLRVRPETHEGPRFLDYLGIPANPIQSLTVANAELAVVWGPFSIQGEGFVNSVNTAATGRHEIYGAYAQASFFLTGENRKYERGTGIFGRVTPHSNFFLLPGCKGAGALELKARWSYLDAGQLRVGAGFTPDAFPANADQLNHMAFGFNWHWNPYTRVMFDYWHSWHRFNGVVNQANLFGIRMQLDF